jgi:hypothetical protein
MKYAISLLTLAIFGCSTSSTHQVSEAAWRRYDILGVYIGLPYKQLASVVPDLVCDVGCGDDRATYLGHPGKFFVGIGDAKVNQITFRFVPTLTDLQASHVRSDYVKLYGASSTRTADGCDVWERVGGKIVLCVASGMSMAHWHDAVWGVTRSVIPKSP